MSKKTFVLVLFLAAWATAAFAENGQAIIPHDSSIMDDLTSLYIESGMTPLSTAGPFSVDELSTMLEKIDPGQLSEAGQKTYQSIKNALKLKRPKPDPIRFELHPEVAVQGYLHTNNDLATTYWETQWADRLPLLSLPIEFWAADSVYAVMDLSLQQTHDAYDPTLGQLRYVNIPLSQDTVDVETPFRAFLSLGGHNWSFIIGRDRFSWGNGETGNFALSDSPDYYDFARLTAYWRDFKYTAMVVSLLTNLAPYEDTPVLTAAEVSTYNFQDVPRYYFLHRLEMTFWDSLNFAVVEGTIIGGVTPKLEFFNPLIIFHDLYNYYNASEILTVETTWTPLRSVEVYAQASCTQIQLPYEIARYGGEASGVPNAWGVLSGVRTRWPLGDGHLDSGVEFAYVNPWLYIKENPLTTYEWWRYQASNLSGSNQWVSSPLGYFTGPDSIVLDVWAGYRVPGSFSAGISYMLELKGENTLDTPYTESASAAALAAPSGVVEQKHVVHLSGTVDPLTFMTVGLDIYGIITKSFNNYAGLDTMDLQTVASVKLRF